MAHKPGRGRTGIASQRRSPPCYQVPPLKLTAAERLRLAHGLWEARRVLLAAAAMHESLRSLALPAAKHCTQVVEALWPEPAQRRDD